MDMDDPLKIETPSTTNVTHATSTPAASSTSTTSATTTVNNSSPMVSISKNSNLETELDLGSIHDPISIKTEMTLLEKTLVQKDKKDNNSAPPPKKDKLLLTPPSQSKSKSPKFAKKMQIICGSTLEKKICIKLECNYSPTFSIALFSILEHYEA